MPSAWSSTAASRWSGVTSGLLAARARSTAEEKASWVFRVHRSGLMLIGILRPVAVGRRLGAGGHERLATAGTSSRRYWRWVTATASRASARVASSSPWSRSTSASSSITRRTPSRLRPALVRLWMWRSRSRSCSLKRRLPPSVRLGSSRPLRS